ncbi:hypothetical protein AOCH_001311, partial [Aspergillus ochraceoroseus]
AAQQAGLRSNPAELDRGIFTNMLGDSSMPEEPRRKRVRKGTRSCWECKRRKIKCIPSPDVSICAGCRERNTPCVRQEYVDDPAAHSADDSALARRVARVESLLETSSGQYHPGPSWGIAAPWNGSGKTANDGTTSRMMRGIHDFLLKNVTSDDELAGNVESVECLALQGMYEVNAGNLRRSWLSFRRAITIAQLLGLHRGAVNSSEDLVETKRHHLWYQISRGERYLSTLLGLPSSTGSAGFPFDAAAAAAAWLSPEDLYHKNLYHISGLILARNQEPCTHSFSTTQRIGEQLDALAAQMPAAWWEIPRTILNTRTKEASAQFERIMCQIWHFELATLAHLPFMLRAATDRRYEYSHISCLDASRNLIKRWIAIHQSPRTTLVFSNLLEFQTFTAATTLVLGLLAPQRRSTDPDVLQARLDDSQLVETVLESFERLPRQGRGGGMTVSAQSVSVIRTLQRFLHHGTASDRLRLEIPFFGVILIAGSGAVQPLQGERILGGNAGHGSSSSSSLDPDGVDSSAWTFEESDMIFFDSLVNTDLEGNWML